jgi:hypothetical protein
VDDLGEELVNIDHDEGERVEEQHLINVDHHEEDEAKRDHRAHEIGGHIGSRNKTW